jgi:uncharacterized protein (DUF1501 family)
MWSRREFLRATTVAVLGACGGLRRVSAAPKKKRPRYFFLGLMSGGIDAILSTDPKSRSEVEPWVDVPYGANEVVEASGIRLGLLLSPLARHIGSLAIVNGIQVRTANHATGVLQYARLKTKVNPRMAEILEIIGGHRDGQPLGTLLDDELFDALATVEHDDLERLARTLHANSARMRGEPAQAAGAQALEESARLYERLVQVPPFKPESWSNDPNEQQEALTLQRILWAFEHDVCACASFKGGKNFDSHAQNLKLQHEATDPFMRMLARFFDELGKRRNAFGTLADNTAGVVGSEIGRFPRINGSLGKDHFPEIPLLFYGACWNTAGRQGGSFGVTNRRMEGLSVSLRNGRDVEPSTPPLVLDDVGTTLLHVAGVDPSPYGYYGRVLDFLVHA